MSQRMNFYQHAPELAKHLMEMGSLLSKSTLDRSLRDLVLLRSSQLNQCAFCVDMHVKEAKIHGERELRLHHLAIWRESPLFSLREKAALEWAEAVTFVGQSGVLDEVYDRVRSQFSEQEITDLTFAIGLINFWNRLSISFRVEPGSADKMFGLDKAGLQ